MSVHRVQPGISPCPTKIPQMCSNQTATSVSDPIKNSGPALETKKLNHRSSIASQGWDFRLGFRSSFLSSCSFSELPPTLSSGGLLPKEAARAMMLAAADQGLLRFCSLSSSAAFSWYAKRSSMQQSILWIITPAVDRHRCTVSTLQSGFWMT